MNLCDVYIEKIISVEEHDNYVIATLDTDCWGHKEKGQRVPLLKMNGRRQVSCLREDE